MLINIAHMYVHVIYISDYGSVHNCENIRNKLIAMYQFYLCTYSKITVCTFYTYVCAAAPDMVGNVVINITTATVDDDGDNDNVSFTLSWDEPFANFDPIVNYTVTIGCTYTTLCPVTVDTDNVTRTADVNFITDLSMMTTLSVIATNTIGRSVPAVRIITGMSCAQVMYVLTYICICMYMYIYIIMYICLLYAKI